MLKSVKKNLLILLGTLSLVLGVIGIFLPVLPTTPFLLLSSFCYLRSSDKLYNWLIHRKVLGAYIYNYLTYKAVTKATKIVSLVFLWLTLALSIILIHLWYLQALLVVVGIGVSIHLLTLKTMHGGD